MKAALTFAIATLLSVPSGRSQEDFPKYPQPSSFSTENTVRNPFKRLDVHSIPVDKPLVVAGTGQEGLAGLFRVTAISIDRIAMAIINRRAFAQGETFKVRANGKTLVVTLEIVRDGSVLLNCEGTIITLPVIVERTKLDD